MIFLYLWVQINIGLYARASLALLLLGWSFWRSFLNVKEYLYSCTLTLECLWNLCDILELFSVYFLCISLQISRSFNLMFSPSRGKQLYMQLGELCIFIHCSFYYSAPWISAALAFPVFKLSPKLSALLGCLWLCCSQ